MKTDQKLDAQIRRSSKLLAELFHLAATDPSTHNSLLASLRRAVNPSVQEELAWLFQAAQSRLYEIGDDLQIIVDQRRKPDPPAGLTRKQHKRLVTFWDKRFAGKGELLMSEDLLAPFHSDQLSFELKPPQANLEEVCRQAIFWRRIRGVRRFTVEEKNSLADGLAVSLSNNLTCHLKEGFDLIKNMTWIGLKQVLEGNLLDNLCVGLEENQRSTLCSLLWHDLWNSLLYACVYAVAGDTSKNFGPLLKLWLSGNLPLGFDKEGYLLVLCAPAQ